MYRTLKDIRNCEQCENGLAEVAVKSNDARRFRKERNHPYRTPFIVDRDRIIHSVAFQRLVNKSQLFPSADASKYTTRLIHSVKVSQIAQTLARAFRLNEDLTEAIALGHDLGHAPFGHIGEDVLRELMIEENGFEHNEESILMAIFFEPGLNLNVQTLEGILKHTKFSMKAYSDAGVVRNNPFELLHIPGSDEKDYKDPFDYWGGTGADDNILFKSLASYEGQVVDIADEIAYITHDVWDLVSRGVVNTVELPEEWLDMFANNTAVAINSLVNGVIDENYKEINKQKKGSITYEIKLPSELGKLVKTMKGWFDNKIYSRAEPKDARDVIKELFHYFKDNSLKSYRESPYGDLIVKKGYKDKRLAGHLVASLTDNEARKLYKKYCK